MAHGAGRTRATLCGIAAALALGQAACSDCHYSGLVAGAVAAYFDPSLSNVVRLEVAGPADGPPLSLAVTDYPSSEDGMPLGQGGGVALDDAINGDPTACGLCVAASRGAAVYAPLRGSAEVTAPAAQGEPFTVVFSGLALQRIDPDDAAPVDDGMNWCLPGGSRFSAATGPWPCSEVGLLMQGASLAEGQSVCLAAPSSGTYQLWTCTGGAIARGTDCAATGKTCDPTVNDSGGAACQ